MSTPLSQDLFESGLDYVGFIRFLWRVKWILLICVCLGTFGLVMVYKKMPNEYTSSGTFFLPIGDQQASTLSRYSALIGGNGAGGGSLSSLIIPLFSSQKLQAMVVERVLKDEVFCQRLTALFKPGDTRSRRDQFMTAMNLNSLAINMDKSGLFVARYSSKDPEVARYMLQVYFQKMEALNTVLELSASREFIVILDAPNRPIRPEKLPLTQFLAIGIPLVLLASVLICLAIDKVRRDFSRF